MDINALTSCCSVYNPESGSYFYKIGINPLNSDIFVTDAVDYVQQVICYYITMTGNFVSKQQAGIIPGSMCFNLRINNSVND